MGHAGGACPELHPRSISLGRQLGSGAFAIVYAAAVDGEDVAIKVLRRKYDTPDDAQYALLLKEGALLCACHHPHILQCKGLVHLSAQHTAGLGEEDGSIGLVMELSKAGSLQEYLLSLQQRRSLRLAHRIHLQSSHHSHTHTHTHTPAHSRTHSRAQSRAHSRNPSHDHGYHHHHPYRLPYMANSGRIRQRYSLNQAVQWIMQLASALDYLHTKDPLVLHRDIKLENVLLFPAPPVDNQPASAIDPSMAKSMGHLKPNNSTSFKQAHNRSRSQSEESNPKHSCRVSASDDGSGHGPCNFIVKLADFGLHQCIGSDRAVYLRRGKTQHLVQASPTGSNHSHHSHRDSLHVLTSGVPVLGPVAAKSREGSAHRGSLHSSGAMTVNVPRGSLYSSATGTSSVNVAAAQQGEDPAAAGLFFTLDESGMARSSGKFLSPAAVVATARKSSKLSPKHGFSLANVAAASSRLSPQARTPAPAPTHYHPPHLGNLNPLPPALQCVSNVHDQAAFQQLELDGGSHNAPSVGRVAGQGTEDRLGGNNAGVLGISARSAQGLRTVTSYRAPATLNAVNGQLKKLKRQAISLSEEDLQAIAGTNVSGITTAVSPAQALDAASMQAQPGHPSQEDKLQADCGSPCLSTQPTDKGAVCVSSQAADKAISHVQAWRSSQADRPHVSFALPPRSTSPPVAAGSGTLQCSAATDTAPLHLADGASSNSVHCPSFEAGASKTGKHCPCCSIGNKSSKGVHHAAFAAGNVSSRGLHCPCCTAGDASCNSIHQPLCADQVHSMLLMGKLHKASCTDSPLGADKSVGRSNKSGALSLYGSRRSHMGLESTGGLTATSKVQLVIPQDVFTPSPFHAKLSGSTFQTVFALTGETGSLLYMPPEVFKRQPYNCQVDVFSLAMLAWQLLDYTPLTTCLEDLELSNAREWAIEVSSGYRPQRPRKCPEALWSLLCRCWDEDPVARPSAKQVVTELQHILSGMHDQAQQSNQQQQAMDAPASPAQYLSKRVPGCCCVS